MADADVAVVDTSISAELTSEPNSVMMEEAVIMEEEAPALDTKPEEDQVDNKVSIPETEVMEESVKEGELSTEDKTSVTTPTESNQTANISNEEAKEEEPTEDISSPPETKAITVAEDEVEDDIICLDEDDGEPDGVSDSKRPRKIEEDDDIMEVDENGIVSKEDKESVGKVIRKMSRQDLEDLVLAKIVEAIVAHTEVGQLRAKVLELQMQKDKMANKMGIMLKQVAELSNAVNNIMENEKRDPKNRLAKAHVIRFNRSVGLQTIIEPSMRSAPPKIIRVPEPIQPQPKQYGGVTAGKSNAFATPQQPVKRVYQGNKVNEKAQNTPSPRKTYSTVQQTTAQTRVLPIAPKPPTSQVTITPTQSVQPGIVDLTDDDPPPSSNAQASGQTTIINGVPYQIVNSTTNAGRSQIAAPGGAQKYIIAQPSGGGAPQNRPLVLNIGSGPQSQQAQPQVVYRGNNITVIPKPAGPPRPNGNVNVTRGVGGNVAATIRPTGGVLAATNAQRKFVLPPLPATPPPKAKNEFFKPPPKPDLTLNEQADGIVLSWNLPTISSPAEVNTYQIFACQESLNSATIRPSQWKRVGDVKALPLPMACTLSQFTEENRYYFIVRGIDVYGRTGPFCDPQNIVLRRKK